MEGLILLWAVALLVCVGIFIGVRSPPDQRSFDTIVAGTPLGWIDSAVGAVAGLPHHEVTVATPTSLVITRSVTPAWAVIIAILAFPIGLVLLLVKRRETATATVESTGEGKVHVRLNGQFTGKLIDRINTVL